jgi:dTDP-4-amino-4,6-dideoxygalactose transaminase
MNQKSMISLGEPLIGQEEYQSIAKVLQSNWITQGEKTLEFERLFADLYQSSHAVAVTSCTAGLHLVLIALGIGPVDEVLVPVITFVDTANSVMYTGAIPVPIDISSIYLPHIDINNATKALTKKTRAVIVMHHAGYSIDLLEWSKFAKDNNLILIEDAAHSPGLPNVAYYSSAAVFSFFSNKNMTTAEGGMILVRNLDLAKRLKRLRAHAMSTDTLDRDKGHSFSYTIDELGWNYRLDDIRAAIGVVQLAKLFANNQRRKDIVMLYRKLFHEINPNIIIPFKSDHISVYHLMAILLPSNVDRPLLMQRLREHQIQTSIHYPLWYKFSYYMKTIGDYSLPNADHYSKFTLTLPLHPKLSDDDIYYIVDVLNKFIN